MQVRTVDCFDSHGAHNTQCDPATRPISVQACSTGISCTTESSTTDFEDLLSSEHPNETNLDENIDDEDEDENHGQRKAPKAVDDDDETEEDEDESDMQGDEPMRRERERKLPLAYQYRIPRAERLVDPNAPNEPT